MTEAKITPLEESEAVNYTDFSTYVHVSQTFWKSQRKAPHETLSQSWELNPENSQYVFSLILKNLPGYISDTLKQDIIDNHPTPIIGYSVLEDDRLKNVKEKGPYQFFLRVPDNIDLNNEDELRAWKGGVNIFNEIATDTLALDIMKNIPKNENNILNQMFAYFTMNIPGGKPKLLGIPKAEKEIKNMVGESSYEKFKQSLVIAMLSGDTSEVDRLLKNKQLVSLNSVALDLGKKYAYGLKSPEFSKKKSKIMKTLTSPIGHAPINYPGIIDLRIIPAINVPQTTPRVIFHETCHYMGQGCNHYGLLEGKYKPLPINTNIEKNDL